MNSINTRIAFTFLLGIFCSQILLAQYFFKQYESPELSAFCSTSIEKTSDGYRMYAEKEEANTRFYLQLEVDENGNERSREIVQFDVTEDRYLRLRDGNFIRFRKQASGAQAQKIHPNGQVLWTRNFSASVEGLSTNILENEAGAILLGYYDDSTPSQRSVYRLSGNSGAVEWVSQIGTAFTTASSSTNKATRLHLTMPTNDGGVIYSVFVGSLYSAPFEYTFRVDGVGQQEAETAFYFRNSDGYTFVDGKNNNAFKFSRTGFETPQSSSYVGDERYTWSAFYNVKEYGSQFSGQRLMLSAATAAADGNWLLAGFKREYESTSNNITAGTYQQEMHFAKVDALGNEIFVNVNYPVVGLIKNISELSDGRIMLSGIRDNMPWMLLVNSNGVPTDMSCPDNINGFSFQGDFRGHHYFFSDTKMPYTQAQQNAQANGGYIATVEDQFQHNLLYSVARDQNKNAFIGLNDLQSEGNPQWENAAPFDFQLFSPSTQNTADNDVVSIVPWASEWVWENRFVERPYFLELDCEGENDQILDDLPENLGFTGCIGVPSSNYFDYDRLSETSSAEVAAGFNTTHWWKATDGDMETYMQTKAEDNASWITRFGGYQFWVEELRIYPRTDGQFPLQNVVLEIGERYSNVLKTIPVQANGNAPIVVTVGSLATFVRLKREGFGVLSFAEIEMESCLGNGLFEERERFFDIGIEFVCPDDIVLQADQSGTATLELDEEGEGFQLNCLYGGNGGIRRRGPQDGDELVPGEYLYEIESSNDVCGSQYCNVKITVLPFEGGSGELTIDCEEVVKIQYPAIESFAFRANWDLPTASTTCNISNEVNFTQVDGITNGSYTRPGTYSISYAASDACGNTATCTFQLEVIRDFNADCDDPLEGYDFLGEYEGHYYYMSKNDYPFRYTKDWLESKEIAQLTGGYLASINSAAENEFLRSKLGNNSVHIGYSNINGTATWANGEAVAYTNIANNSAATGYAEMNFWAGTWTLKNNGAYKPHILELPCGGGNTISEITLDSCEDIFITTEAGASGAIVNWNLPTANTTCRTSSAINISQESGAANASYFEVGTYSITYLLSDACDNTVTCTFQVTVSAEENTDCPDTVEGFELLGEFENSKYYISNRNSQWSQASTTAQQLSVLRKIKYTLFKQRKINKDFPCDESVNNVH